MRICRRLRLELGEDVFSSWFGCLELDALSDDDAYLSVPTKFLKCWIQSHYTDKILQALTTEFPMIKRVSVNLRSSTRLTPPRAIGNPIDTAPCGDADLVKGRNVSRVLLADWAVRRDAAIVEKAGFNRGLRGRDFVWVALGPPLDFLEFSRRFIQPARPCRSAENCFRGAGRPIAFQSALSPRFCRIG